MSVLLPGKDEKCIDVAALPSDFKASDLEMLNDPSVAYLLPLAVIALIDMNAFFAQCEQIRLNCSLSDPVVCCQWQSLIAVSYAARKYGINRMDTLASAKKKCPGLVVGHAAVFKKGDSHWQYLDRLPDQAVNKVSLDPYRRELRKIFKVLSRECDLVEKASVDECYLDLGRLVYSKLLELFPQLLKVSGDEDLPMVPEILPSNLRWQGKIYPTPEESATEHSDNLHPGISPNTTKESAGAIICDWDDVCMLIGSEILYHIRREVYNELKYTTSGGLASTKTVAKLAGGLVKPDFQTVVRSRAMYLFLNNFELKDFNQMGGQLGDRILHKLNAPPGINSLSYLRTNWSLEDLKQEFIGEEQLAQKVYDIPRGNFRQELKLRTSVKSMMSRKNFQSHMPVKTIGDCLDWIRVYVGDLYGRLIELDDENLNLSILQKNGDEREKIFRPRTVSLQLTTTSWTRLSRQTQIPVIKDLEKLKKVLESTAFRLLCELMDNLKASEHTTVYKKIKPTDEHLHHIGCPSLANMGISCFNFVTSTDLSLIDSYLVSKGPIAATSEELKRLFEEVNHKASTLTEPPKIKKRNHDNSYVQKLFADFVSSSCQARDSTNIPTAKAKGIFKEDKSYVNKLFDDFNTSIEVERAVSESPKREQRVREPSNDPKSPINCAPAKKFRKTTGEKSLNEWTESNLKSLMKTKYCDFCKLAVEDVFEHSDYHYALQLSSKLNSGAQSACGGSKVKKRGQSKISFSKKE